MELETIYSAALERQRVLSQQRPAHPDDFAVRRVVPPSTKALVGRWLAAHPGWWTIDQITQALDLDRRLVASGTSHLVYQGQADRELPPLKGAAIHRGQRQRYRWRT